MDTLISKIPLVDLKAQYRTIEPEIQAAMTKVLESTGFIMGAEVYEFERQFAAFCGAEHAIAVSSGTSAIHLSLRALGVGPGDEVITIPHTFFATAEAVIHSGARPVFVDVEPDFFTLDPGRLEAAITARTRAILPVHLYGQCAEMEPILAIAGKYGIPVIEDAAQAHGAKYKDQKAGTIGKAACFSFYPGKNLGAFGDAGAVTTNDAEFADKVRRSRDHGRKDKYVHLEVGYGERLDTLQAAILLVKLNRISGWNARRQSLANLYQEYLADLTELTLPLVRVPDWAFLHRYLIPVGERVS
jgi:dTDP-4-amino-4,6-dideoxygalactose transaminase